MPLVSKLLRDNRRLQDCLEKDSKHVIPGESGDHVSLIQQALFITDGASLDDDDLVNMKYGDSTANAVRAFKVARSIKRPGQPYDSIVGIGTIGRLDKELKDKEPAEPDEPNLGDVASKLTEFARPVSMNLTADPFAKLELLVPGADPLRFAFDFPDGWTGNVELADALTASDLKVVATMLHGETEMAMPMTVANSTKWRDLSIRRVGTNFRTLLPLVRKFAIAAHFHNGPKLSMNRSSQIFPLKRVIQSSMTIVFAWSVEQNGQVNPVDLAGISALDLEAWLKSGGFSGETQTPLVFIVGVYELVLCEPDDNFQPKEGAPIGAADVARLFPLLSIWSSEALENATAEFLLKRPANSPMTEMFAGGRITSSLYTDVNGPTRKIWDEMHPVILAAIAAGTQLTGPFAPLAKGGVVAALHMLPSTRWDSMFAHYKVDAVSRDLVVVDPSKPWREDSSTARMNKRTLSDPYADTAKTTKVERQGMFDNIHIAPSMNYKGKSAAMAPICQHDCLHMHWRWGSNFTDQYLHGWANGLPHTKAGAPHIPENQKLTISCSGPDISYVPDANGIAQHQWQIFMHHGLGYVTKLNAPGQAAVLIEFASLASVSVDFGAFYYHNRVLEADPGLDATRLYEDNFWVLENM